MRFFWKYLFPPLYGLLIYIIVRLINDTVAEVKFWERDWRTMAIEIVCCLFMGYLLAFSFRKLFVWFDKKAPSLFNYRTIARELFWIFFVNQLCVNALITPMAAITDDGLSWGDVAVINTIPLLFSLVYYGVARSSKLLNAYIEKKLQLEKVTNDQLQTELKFLKAQYHPHFLFNALNTIYFQMDENVAAAKRSVEKFSSLLRYQLYDQQQTVPVSRELDYLKAFIELQKVRMNERLKLELYFDERLNGQQVYPLLFMPFVENAFKYAGGEYWIRIEARQETGRIAFSVQNAIPSDHEPSAEPGIGLENLKRRLMLLYPGKHELHLDKNKDNFLARLVLDIQD